MPETGQYEAEKDRRENDEDINDVLLVEDLALQRSLGGGALIDEGIFSARVGRNAGLSERRVVINYVLEKDHGGADERMKRRDSVVHRYRFGKVVVILGTTMLEKLI